MAAPSSEGELSRQLDLIKFALTVKMLSGAPYLDVMLFRLASSTVYYLFHSTDANITKRIAMPGLPSAQAELQSLARAEKPVL
jgi:hypothetical protein